MQVKYLKRKFDSYEMRRKNTPKQNYTSNKIENKLKRAIKTPLL